MKVYEALEYLGSLQSREKESWERTRIMAYITAQVNSSKKIKPSDIMQFPWDEEKHVTEITQEERERLIKKAEYYKQWLT